MHKGVILLVECESKEEVMSYVESFMEPYGNGYIWDYYEIGGRWHGLLKPNVKSSEYAILDNIVELKDCLQIVEEWIITEEYKEEIYQKMLQSKIDAQDGKYDMSGYYAKVYGHIANGDFSFESNVYNITEMEAEEIPNNIEDYWAVIIDMHN